MKGLNQNCTALNLSASLSTTGVTPAAASNSELEKKFQRSYMVSAVLIAVCLILLSHGHGIMFLIGRGAQPVSRTPTPTPTSSFLPPTSTANDLAFVKETLTDEKEGSAKAFFSVKGPSNSPTTAPGGIAEGIKNRSYLADAGRSDYTGAASLS